MTVETFEPEVTGVRMTPKALEHARRQLERGGGRAIRLAVTKSGCSGYMYKLEYLAEPTAEDREFRVDEAFSIFVAPDVLPLVQGTEIDLETEGLNSVLKFRNPNAQFECGCGESFAV